MNVGLVLDTLVEWSLRESPEIGITAGTDNIVVGETNDGWLNDIIAFSTAASQPTHNLGASLHLYWNRRC